jgi:phosphoserine phosphatase RsbU/P
MKKSLLLHLLLASPLCAPAHAQDFDLSAGREAVASLDGLWRFHAGDDLQWANPSFEDSQWPLLRSDESWAAQGYKRHGLVSLSRNSPRRNERPLHLAARHYDKL